MHTIWYLLVNVLRKGHKGSGTTGGFKNWKQELYRNPSHLVLSMVVSPLQGSAPQHHNELRL